MRGGRRAPDRVGSRLLAATPMLRLVLVLLAATVLVACGDASDGGLSALPEATSAAEVADRMLDRFESNIASVDSFAVTGAGLRMIYRVVGDTSQADRVRVRTERVDSVAFDADAAQMLQLQIPNVQRIARGFRRATFGGLQTIGERRGYVLSSEDPGALIGELGTAESRARETLRILVDADTYDVLEVFRTASVDSLERPVSQRLVFEDFRTEGGLTLPYTIRQVGEGMDQFVTFEQRTMLGGRLELERMQLEQAPPTEERTARLQAILAQQAILNGEPQRSELVVDDVEVYGGR